ncbi:hypothetical protein MIND_00832700 [Mycena indigotica]|uniref:Uncharacterized protein n=1 Tax=Mycena indigotica TaxID=2126181 RepID=A0A8H6SG96_9AGAR|nr:uncharacterized protein MIND_00832700 [Mycena indigotica]KAF7298849.1 hypothetical protein MIND_00832700 [Mycena indigotica]
MVTHKTSLIPPPLKYNHHPPSASLPPSQRPAMSGAPPAQQGRAPPPAVLPSRPSDGQRRPQQADYYPQQPQPQQPLLQRQPSSPQPDSRLQRQPSRPNQYPPQQPDLPAPAFMQAAPLLPPSASLSTSDSSATLSSMPSSFRSYNSESMLIRGKADDDLENTDAFWRRFNTSAVNAQQPDAEKSSWLGKNEGKTSRYYRVMWLVGFVFVILAAGGIGIGVFLSFRSGNSNTRPGALGGSADNTSAGGIAATLGGGQAPAQSVAPAATQTGLHVSPTNTVD